MEAGRGHRIPWKWTRELLVVGAGTESGRLQKEQVFETTEPSPATAF